MSAADIATQYREKLAWHAGESERSRQRAVRIGYLRLATFGMVLLLPFAFGATSHSNYHPIFVALSLASLGAFVTFILAHRVERRVLAEHDRARSYYQRAVWRVTRDWQALPDISTKVAATHPYAADLDVIGHASLLKLVDVVSAVPGRPVLLSWLLGPASSPEEVRQRQSGVQELAANDELREQLGMWAQEACTIRRHELEEFLAWCDGTPGSRSGIAVLWAARLIAVSTIVFACLQAAGVLRHPVWVVSVALGAILLISTRRETLETVRLATLRRATLRNYSAMLSLLSSGRFVSPRLLWIQTQIAAGGGATGQIARLGRIMAWADVRRSPMLHSALQLFLLWDVHVAASLKRWRSVAGVHARSWMTALAEAEVLAAFATLAHDNPTWCFPTLYDGSDEPAVIDAVAAGHPLLSDDSRVANDIMIGPPGAILVITGSNMSGKSTLLRTIGLNVVLAQAGAPVCARRFRTPLLRVHTAIRIQDSLERGLSLFMAEVHSLKRIIDAARDSHRSRPVLYLLDEILRGTNTAEREIAVRTVIQHLLATGAIGAASTHDLALANREPLHSAARLVHFTEHFNQSSGQPVMTFDFKLLPGASTSANALALLKLIGISELSQ